MHRVLITGGAGFIGSHLADELLRRGHEVRALDVLSPQVHGGEARRPEYLSRDVELIEGDCRDPGVVRKALRGVDVVYHLAAAVGVGQSMYEVRHYVEANNTATAVLLEALIETPVKRLVVASSMSIYGEGLYRRPDGTIVENAERDQARVRGGDWETRDRDGTTLQPIPTPETKRPSLASVYALTKYDQERLCLLIGDAYDIPTTAMRFFNVYGPRQALGNPYTGVLAIFASRILNGNPPLIFEDGEQKRDFVSVYDVARACALALDAPASHGRTINVGSGESRSVKDVADAMLRALDRKDIQPEVTGKFRVGDVRHCFADISLARDVLGYRPQVEFQKGVQELAEWLRGQQAVDRVDAMKEELAKRGLVV
ncbi:MAG TPA: NAD-dependent epimerase/dehydratase family protein [Candidatus Thermoplasmatota archaeon]|nr:NAD-dependent epimerase/dehydratase family protein [Candidatus Thermoplasmatota archaeon]